MFVTDRKNAATDSGLSSSASESAATLAPWERRVVLEEIARIALLLGRALSDAPLPASPSLSLPAGPDSPLERIRLLDAVWPRMQAALEAMERCPETGLVAERQSIQPARSQGGPDVARTLANTPQGLAVWGELQQRSGAGSPRRISELRPKPSFDTPVNRLALAALMEVEREARILASLAEFCGEWEEAARMRSLLDAAGRRRDSRLLSTLLPASLRERQTVFERATSARISPAYRALFNTWKQLNQPLHFDWSHTPLLSLPSLEEWHLYEVWCYLQVAVALYAAEWRLLEGEALRWTPDGLRLTLCKGRMSRLRFRSPQSRKGGIRRSSSSTASLELCYQPYYPSANQLQSVAGVASETTAPAYVSRTHGMQPDIALQWRGGLYLLDPKFRTYAGSGDEQEDVDKMHTYRDAIVLASRQRPHSRETRCVVAAWCLFPGRAESDFSLPVRAYPTASATHPFGTAGIGAMRLRPGDPVSPPLLTQLLSSWLEN